MKIINTNILHFAPIAVGIALLVSFFVVQNPVIVEGAGINATVIGSATTTAVTSVTTSARIMATTTNPTGEPGVTSFERVYAVVCNPNANPVWINIDNDKLANLATGNVTTVIATAAGHSACFEITDRNIYHGSVTASSTNQTATTITVKQYVK